MQHLRQPLIIKLWNLFPSGPKGIETLMPQDIMKSAIKRSGYSDFGDLDFVEGLETFLASVNETGGLHSFGRFYVRQMITAMLVHRLRVVELLRLHPEIIRERVVNPLFILGLPRSGTTLLFNLLAQDPVHRFMSNWEAFISQVPPKGDYTFETDPRRRQAKRMLRVQKYLMPDLDTMHEFGAELPEECTPILMQSFATQTLANGYDVPRYSAWLDHADHDPTYRHHKEVLQALQWKYPGERWILKAPDYFSGFGSLLDTYPDARFIHIHRDPVWSISSGASLAVVYRSVCYADVNPSKIGLQLLNRLATDLDSYMKERPSEHSGRFYDVQYRSLVKDPIGIIREAYAHFGFPLTDNAERRMRRYVAENPKNKHGAHEYKPEDFGLNASKIQQRFQDYINAFEVPIDVRSA